MPRTLTFHTGGGIKTVRALQLALTGTRIDKTGRIGQLTVFRTHICSGLPGLSRGKTLFTCLIVGIGIVSSAVAIQAGEQEE